MHKDISTLLREIKDQSGWSEPRIAREISTSQPTINRILKGQKECKSSLLRAIEDLHKRVCFNNKASCSSDAANKNKTERRKNSAPRRETDKPAMRTGAKPKVTS